MSIAANIRIYAFTYPPYGMFGLLQGQVNSTGSRVAVSPYTSIEKKDQKT